MRLPVIKWVGTSLCLVGMGLTSFNVYPANLFVSGVGSALWAVAGGLQRDPPMYTVEAVAVLIYLAGIGNWIMLAA